MVDSTKQTWKPNKDDCRMLDAITKAANQIHAEFDCLSDHVMTGKRIREQISQIIWKHIGQVNRTQQACGHVTKASHKKCGKCFACCDCKKRKVVADGR